MNWLINTIVTAVWYPWVHPGRTAVIGFIALFIWMAIRDVSQKSNAIKRNFPLAGMARYLIASAGPPLRQYLFENDRDERPIPRYIRNWIYASAENKEATVPFGTQLDIDRPGTVLMRHSPIPKNPDYDVARVRVGGDGVQPYDVAVFNISAMSFGSLGQNAITALNIGASHGGFYHNTGEGGVSPYHLAGGGDLVWQLGTAKFGARKVDGSFDPEAFKAVVANPSIKMVEIKLSQGAKPGKGGILPKEKITREIANIRGVEMDKDVISPPRHAEWDTAEGMCAFIKQVRGLAGKPVGIKFCLGDPRFLDDICKAFVETGIHPDYVAVDGAEGGTGAAPLAHTNLLGYPMLDALMMTENKLLEYGLRDKIKICASGKIWTGGALAVALASGADFAASARGFMLSVGCIQALHCNTNFCPVGVATQKKWLQRGLVPKVKGPHVANYQHAVLHELAAVVGSCGYKTHASLNREDIMKVVGWHDIRPMSDIVPYPSGSTAG